MKKWNERSPEVATLLNPAFCGLLLYLGVKAYSQEINEGVPYAFPFIMLPLVLHKQTRDNLPRSVSTTFSSWITKEKNILVKANFPKHASHLSPYIKEALIFAVNSEALQIMEKGQLMVTNKKVKVKESDFLPTKEVEDCMKKSTMCGKWFARTRDFKTSLALLGVKL